jgi:small subunit ribosomal protein S8
MSDSISNFLTTIRNAYSAGKEVCECKFSNMHWAIANILKDEGYLRDVSEGQDKNGFKNIVITLKYVDETPAITGIKRHSKPGRRLYYKSTEIPRVLGGLGIGILTTSKGVMKDREARRNKVGGEMVCAIW